MRAGKLRHRIEVQSPESAAIGDAGNPDITWRTEGTVWADVEPLSVAERLTNAQVEAQATHTVTIRYNKAITQTWRFKFGTRIFNIASIIPPALRPIEMQILVEEVVA